MDTHAQAETSPGALSLRPHHRLLMLAFNALPLLLLLAFAATACLCWTAWYWRAAASIALLYLVPPLAARLVRALAPINEGRIPVGARAFFSWWALSNLQMLFCRLPFLEEILRLVPGCYSLWLRLWGARVGRLTYWAAGLRILDRSFVRIGDGVLFGAAVRINPHVLRRNELGAMELLLATVVIEDNAIVGGYSLLSAGTEIAAGECTRAFTISPPFNRWENGGRTVKDIAQRAP